MRVDYYGGVADVAAAALAYEKVKAAGMGMEMYW